MLIKLSYSEYKQIRYFKTIKRCSIILFYSYFMTLCFSVAVEVGKQIWKDPQLYFSYPINLTGMDYFDTFIVAQCLWYKRNSASRPVRQIKRTQRDLK